MLQKDRQVFAEEEAHKPARSAQSGEKGPKR